MSKYVCNSCNHCHHEDSDGGHIIQLCIAIIVLIVSFFLPDENKYIGFIISYIIAGYYILISSLKNIFTKEFFDEKFLMSIATIGAICIKEYPEAAMVMILYLLGEHLQDKAVDRTRKSITKLMDFRQDYANVEDNGIITIMPPEEVEIGSIIVIKPGEKIPLDGIITEGSSQTDNSSLTGESFPINVKAGDTLYSGCLNLTGLLKVKVTKSYKESTVSKILELVEYSAEKKSETEKFISKFAKIYTPVVVFLALCIAIIPWAFFNCEEIKIWILRALTFLVISCPCAFVISVPLTFFAGIGSASKHGILIKGANYIEMLSRMWAIAFDKTGTLTKGKFVVTDILPTQSTDEYELIKYAAYAEYNSNHPIAKSIIETYNKEIDPSEISNVREYPGLGIKAKVYGNYITVGNKELMEKFGIYVVDNAACTIYVAKDNTYIGQIIVADMVKINAKDTVLKLKGLVSEIEMLTGDTKENSKRVAEITGIEEYYANLLPINKIEKIEELINRKRKNHYVAFAGDGINDAPVLMRADIGIAMGVLGSDAAIEAADVVIADDNIGKIPLAIIISRHTMKIVKQNIIFAITIKILFLILGAFGLITMWGAVFADVGVTLIAVLNSLRTLRTKE